MKNLKWSGAVTAILATTALLLKLQAQTAANQDVSTTQTEPLVMNASDMATVSTLSTAELAAFLSALAATPQIAYTNIGDQASTFYSLQNPSWPPLPYDSAHASAWPMNGFLLLSDIGFDYAAAAQANSARLRSGSGMMSADDLTPPGNGDTNGYGSYTNSFVPFVLNTNILWIELSQVDTTNGLIYAALHKAVGSVYAVWVTTNLAGDWQVEAEVQPTDTNRQTFTLSTRSRDWLWLKAEDWSHKDSNGDGVPDAWAWRFFGAQYLSVNASNLDAQGVNTIGFDYTNGLDPNVISFTIGITNRFINTDAANVRLNITAGVPSYYAMRINDATGTNWQAFAATNLAVSLGTTDGVYSVSVGLKGFAPDATETWKKITFYRAAAPLVLMPTNLPALSGSRPFIDPAGWASRQLQSLTWTLVNANGVTHTGLGAAVGDGLNPENPILVTNQFSCVDLALALGTNHITLQAADWAGNVAVTNFDYVFATNGDVTAPVISLLWPTNGSAISGDTFLVRAWLDDDTATAVLQYTDTNAEVQTIPGQLERGGNLWFANVPLAAGTNGFTLTATDAAGNVSRTNFSVTPGGLTLAITSFSDDSLNSGYVTVYGTVSDPNSTVSVNGVAGTNDAGNWSVADVPVPPDGAVMFLAQATGGGGATGEAAVEKERSPVMFTQTYHYSLDYTVTNVGATWGPVTNGAETHHISLAWARGVGGTNENNWVFISSTDGTVESNATVTVWPADAGYLPTLGGQQIVRNYVNGGMFEGYTNAVAAPSVEWMEKTVSDGSEAGVYPVSWSESSDREVRLFTGGKALRQRQNLFDLSADLTQVEQVDWNVPDWDSLYATGGFLGPDSPPVKVPPGQIRLDELGPLGGDGHLWKILPDNREYKVTPKAEGYSFTGGLPGLTKYKSHFEVFVRQPFPDFFSGHDPYTPDNPPPIGYPIYDLDVQDAGHAWWKLSSDAPVDILNQYVTTNVSRWLNQSAGYGPDGSASYISYIPPVKQGPGHVYPGDDSQTVYRIYSIGFQGPGLIEGLVRTEALSNNPGTWNSATNNCVHQAIQTGNATGISLPDGGFYPEFFGYRLPPSDP